MNETLPQVDPDGLLEYSVAYTERALNHMSRRFQGVMTDLSSMLKQVYAADAALVMPGGGTFGMEAVARQFATGRPVLIVRNGLFSYRWSQILDTGGIAAPGKTVVLKAQRATPDHMSAWRPPPADSVTVAIAKHEPAVVFAAHVDTASGIMLPDEYLSEVAEATHSAGGLFVLDCVASGAAWVDMERLGIDVLISAPQKGWSSAPGVAMICFSVKAMQELARTEGTSFSMDLRRWLAVMSTYEDGLHTYYATLPTMTLLELRNNMQETLERGLGEVRERQFQLGERVRTLLAESGFPSVAAPGFEAPGVVVSYTDDPEVQSGKKFAEHGLQVAAGVPLMCDEPQGFSTFRIGLFGLDKLGDVERTAKRLGSALGELSRNT